MRLAREFVALALVLLGGAAPAINVADFPETTLEKFEAALPKDPTDTNSGYRYEQSPIALSILVTATGKFRHIDKRTKQFLQMFENTMGQHLKTEKFAHLYNEEVDVTDEAGKPLHLAVPDVTAKEMRNDTKAGDRLKLLLRYFGKNDGRAQYVVSSYVTYMKNGAPEDADPKNWTELCRQLKCTEGATQLVNPPYPFTIEGRFTGKRRPTESSLVPFLGVYRKNFPKYFKLTAAAIQRGFPEEAEFEDMAREKRWVPLQKADLDAAVADPKHPRVRLGGGAYGTRKGRVYVLGVEVKGEKP